MSLQPKSLPGGKILGGKKLAGKILTTPRRGAEARFRRYREVLR